MANSFSVLVLSCDKYADLWKPFFECFEKRFPKGDWNIYIGTNTIKCGFPGVKTIFSGVDQDWSTSYKRILEQIPEQKLFVILEDLFLASDIDKNEFLSISDFMFQSDAMHIRYWANPYPDKETKNSLIGECIKGAPYRSTVCGFWDRQYLIDLLIDGESPWNFEIMGSYRTSYSEGFYATKKPICRYKNIVEKGQWIPDSVEWALSNHLPITIESRPLLKGGNQFKSRIQMCIFDLILRIPWQFRLKLMNTLRKILISY